MQAVTARCQIAITVQSRTGLRCVRCRRRAHVRKSAHECFLLLTDACPVCMAHACMHAYGLCMRALRGAWHSVDGQCDPNRSGIACETRAAVGGREGEGGVTGG